MKKSTFTIALSIVLLIGTSYSVFSQSDVNPDLAKFLILVETTDNGVKLSSKEGCVFTELFFTLEIGRKQAVDQYGMSSLKGDEPVKDGDFPYFLFIIERTKEGLNFEGKEGTAWKKLSFSCPESKCHQFIDQNGMAGKN